jgi:hypothetical protein
MRTSGSGSLLLGRGLLLEVAESGLLLGARLLNQLLPSLCLDLLPTGLLSLTLSLQLTVNHLG